MQSKLKDALNYNYALGSNHITLQPSECSEGNCLLAHGSRRHSQSTRYRDESLMTCNNVYSRIIACRVLGKEAGGGQAQLDNQPRLGRST